MISRRTLIGHIGDELLTEVRATSWRRESMETNPRAYSAAETERIYADAYRAIGRIVTELAIETWRNWQFESNGGAVWYQEDD